MFRDSKSNPEFDLAQPKALGSLGLKFFGWQRNLRKGERDGWLWKTAADAQEDADGELTNGLRSGQPSRTLTHSLAPRSLSHTILDNRLADSFFSISLFPQRITKLEKGFHHPLSLPLAAPES